MKMKLMESIKYYTLYHLRRRKKYKLYYVEKEAIKIYDIFCMIPATTRFLIFIPYF